MAAESSPPFSLEENGIRRGCTNKCLFMCSEALYTTLNLDNISNNLRMQNDHSYGLNTLLDGLSSSSEDDRTLLVVWWTTDGNNRLGCLNSTIEGTEI